jgi:hypothetical protein
MDTVHKVLFVVLISLGVFLIWATYQLIKPTTFYNIDPSEDDI